MRSSELCLTSSSGKVRVFRVKNRGSVAHEIIMTEELTSSQEEAAPSKQLISLQNGNVVAVAEIAPESLITGERPILRGAPDSVMSAEWRRLNKKVQGLRPSKNKCNVLMFPSWDDIVLNDALVRLLFTFSIAPDPIKQHISAIASLVEPALAPYDYLIRKASGLIVKSGLLGSDTAVENLLIFFNRTACQGREGEVVVYPTIAMVPHACNPNCIYVPRLSEDPPSPVAFIVALRQISPGEVITISHLPPHLLRGGRDERAKWLRGVKGMNCSGDCCTKGGDLQRRIFCSGCQDENCFQAPLERTPEIWQGSLCGFSSQCPVPTEDALIKKTAFLSTVQKPISDILLIAQSTISECREKLGPKHFATQKMILLQFIAAAESVAKSDLVDPLIFDYIPEFLNFGNECGLPFSGIDDIAGILTDPEFVKNLGKGWARPDLAESMEMYSGWLNKAAETLAFTSGIAAVDRSKTAIAIWNNLKEGKGFMNNAESQLGEQTNEVQDTLEAEEEPHGDPDNDKSHDVSYCSDFKENINELNIHTNKTSIKKTALLTLGSVALVAAAYLRFSRVRN